MDKLRRYSAFSNSRSGPAHGGRPVNNGITDSDNRRSYQSDNSVALNVDKLVVNDKHDARALAYEISTVQRRAALGMGG